MKVSIIRSRLPGSLGALLQALVPVLQVQHFALQRGVALLQLAVDPDLLLDLALQAMAFREAPLLTEIQAFRERSPLLAERIHLLGEISHADLASHFSAADLFLTSSPAEGSNFALLEALACGTPPVASDIPAHRVLTGDGAVGRLFDAADAQSCARALVAAASSISDQARAATRRHFEENLGWPAVAKQAVRAYEALAAGKPNAPDLHRSTGSPRRA